MNGTAGALGYLILHTTRNRIAKQVARIRNPRYAFALLFGLGYLYLTFLRPGMDRERGASFITAMHGALIAGMLFLTVAVTWLFGRTSSALAFLPAEVHFLLPGPLSRRQLLGYRMVRSQLVVLLNALIWSVILRRFGLTIPAPIRFGSAWALFTLLSLHQLGAALVLAPPVTGTRRLVGWTIRAAVVGAVVTILVALGPVVARFGVLGIEAGFSAITAAIQAPPVSIVLAPFLLLAAPILATTTAAWAGAFAIVLLIIVGHVAWILSMDVEFADLVVAATAKRSARIAALRAARSGTSVAPKAGKATRHWLPLAPLGPPVVAIAWKNTIALFRGGGARSVVIVVGILVLVVASRTMSAGTESADRAAILLPYVMIVSMTLLMGPRLLRNDLRQDLLRLSTLKTYPLKGSVLFAGEVLSPTLVLTLFQLVMLIVGYFMVPGAAAMLTRAGVASALLLLLPVVLLVLNGINVVIQNGITLMFPSWVRLGADSGGVEAMGQNLLVTFGSFLALMLSLLLPLGATAGMIAFVHFTAGPRFLAAGIAAGVTVGVLLLLAEILAMIGLFGRTFDRIDPTAIG